MRLAAPRRSPRRSGGFALLIVLWTLVLIAFIVLHLTASGRTEIRIAGNLVDNAVTAAAADGAIAEAIFNLSNPRPDQRWRLDGSAHPLTIGGSRVIVRLEDEAARINPNLASPVLLEALLRAVGSAPETARSLAAAIGDWVGSSDTPAPQAALLAEYRAAGLDYGPPGSPLETLGELGRVLGMTPALLAKLRPHLTLFGPAEPDPTTADPVVAAALAQILQQDQGASPVNAEPRDVLTARIIAAALGPGNARVTRTAIVRVGPSLPQGYVVLAWGNRVD
ncbi:MAG: general secretion pathway protein GspK [Stellaceae bacterium]